MSLHLYNFYYLIIFLRPFLWFLLSLEDPFCRFLSNELRILIVKLCLFHFSCVIVYFYDCPVTNQYQLTIFQPHYSETNFYLLFINTCLLLLWKWGKEFNHFFIPLDCRRCSTTNNDKIFREHKMDFHGLLKN